MATARVQETPLPPVSRAHQAGLQHLIGQLQTTGQDVTLLAQLAESLPLLRAGLSASERQRIEALDANETVVVNALHSTQAAIGTLHNLVGDHALPNANTMLIDAATLRQIASAAQLLAEAATDLALRTSTRAGMLE